MLATPIPGNRMVLSIGGPDIDLSGLTNRWAIETLGGSYRPSQVLLEGRMIYLVFPTKLWELIGLKKAYHGIYRGSNLLDYLGTQDSAFGMTIEENEPVSLTPIVPMMIGLSVALLAVGGALAMADR